MLDSLSSNDIKELFSSGKKIKGKHFNLIIKQKEDNILRFAVIISGKSKASERNKIKRRLREIIRPNKKDIKYNFLIIVKKEVLNLPFLSVKENLLNQFKEAKLI